MKTTKDRTLVIKDIERYDCDFCEATASEPGVINELRYSRLDEDRNVSEAYILDLCFPCFEEIQRSAWLDTNFRKVEA